MRAHMDHSHSALKTFFLLLFVCFDTIGAQSLIPSRLDGFWYKNRAPAPDSIFIEAFFDPVCPDSRDSWPPLKQALEYYGPRISLLVHPFPLPYHDNAFVTSRALHIVNKLNASATFDLLDLLFDNQEEFYSQATFTMSRSCVLEKIVDLGVKAVGDHYYAEVKSGFRDSITDQATRISFKYGCSRGVYGTPFFFVNGFLLPDAGSTIDFEGWKSIIDPLVREEDQRGLDPVRFF